MVAIFKNCCLLAPNQTIKFDSPFIKYPILGSVKFDGFRLIIRDGELLSRTLKPYGNRNLKKYLEEICKISKEEELVFDGELYDNVHFTELSSMFRSYSAPIRTTVIYNVFDMLTKAEWDMGGEPYFFARFNRYSKFFEDRKIKNCSSVPQVQIASAEEAVALFNQSIGDGYEGLMLRSANGRYKHNRATLKEGIIFKFKEWMTEDGQIIRFEQGRKMKTEVQKGERTRDVRGFLERSHKQDDYELEDRIGSTIVRMRDGTEVGVGAVKGFKEVAKKLNFNWENREEFIGRWVEFRYQGVGTKDRPRMGAITKFRPDLDEAYGTVIDKEKLTKESL